ncbi:MAG: hypothetical protein AAF501_02570 [Pseudomonadota bacterium]
MTTDKTDTPKTIEDNDLDTAQGGVMRHMAPMAAPLVTQTGNRLGLRTAGRNTTAYGKDGSKGGNVETTWKVEEGET